MLRPLTRTAALILVGALAIGCGDDDDDGGPTQVDVRDFVAALTTQNGQITATFQSGSPPSASGGPAIQVVGGQSVINGGSAQVAVSSASEFTTVFLSIEGVDGYWEITIPSTTFVQLLLLMANELPQQNFDFLYQAATNGAVGSATVVNATAFEVGAGEVQVSVSWDTPTDVDLHVVEPSGEEIFFGDPVSQTGGMLDLDSNAACALDNVNNENITWEDQAPRGEYIVRVDYWSNCGITQTTDFVVTVRIGDQTPQTFTGSFAPEDEDMGGLGDGRTITTFTF